MKRDIFFSFLIWLLTLPVMLVSAPVVALLLLTSWSGRTTIFGNQKWGRATDHPDHPTKGSYWLEFSWLVLRNPVNNLADQYLSVRQSAYDLTGDAGIGDKHRGGFYAIRMRWAWEYYWIKPYNFFGKRCIRARIGWKINDNTGDRAMFVFAINPWKTYLGV